MVYYCSHVWAGAAQSSFSNFDSSKSFLQSCGGKPIFHSATFHRHNIASLLLLYHHSYGKCLDEFHFRSLHLGHTLSFPQTQITLISPQELPLCENRLACGCFLKHYNLYPLQIKGQLLSILFILKIFTPPPPSLPFISHTSSLF